MAPHAAESSQSARGDVKSWSATGGMREATFKKKGGGADGRGAGAGHTSLGFAAVLKAADEGKAEADESVAVVVEDLLLRLEGGLRLDGRSSPSDSDEDGRPIFRGAATHTHRARLKRPPRRRLGSLPSTRFGAVQGMPSAPNVPQERVDKDTPGISLGI